MSIVHSMKGILPALITPYDEDGSISVARTRRLVHHLMDRGVNGFYLCGSTGEGFLLSPAERKQLLELVLSEVKGAVPVIAHIGTMDTGTSVELTKHARQAGADAVSAVAPFYYKHGLEQLKEHYLDIANAADIPLVIYHFPAMTGVQAPASFYGELARHENIIGLKYTALDSYGLQQIIAECGPEFLVFNGPDEALLSGLTLGCVGAIGSTYNIMPGLFLELYHKFHAGNIRRARALQSQANLVIRELLKYETIAFVREILRLQGIETGRPRKPIQQLNEAQCQSIREFALQHSFLGI